MRDIESNQIKETVISDKSYLDNKQLSATGSVRTSFFFLFFWGGWGEVEEKKKHPHNLK